LGILSLYITVQARSKKYAHRQKPLAIIGVLLYTVLSFFVFYKGVLYICEIWMGNPRRITSLLISLAWIAIIIVTHLLMYKWTEKKKRKGRSMRFKSQIFQLNRIESIFASAFPSAEITQGAKVAESAEVAKVADTDHPDDAADKNEAIKNERSFIIAAKDEEQSKRSSVKFSQDTKDVEHKTKSRPTLPTYVAPEDAPYYWLLYMNKVVESFPFFCRCLQSEYGLENISQKRIDYVDRARESTKLGKFSYNLKRCCWYLTSFACLFFTVVNIGATHQQCRAKNELTETFDLLYPPDYLSGTMCAWDAPGPNATIKTFDSLQDVYDDDYQVIHCGACGTCSNWNDITLQYTSREVLAGITKVCAKRSLGRRTNFSDPEDHVVMCNRELVGFTAPCAMSWTWDEVHTKNNAVFVFIQANIANYFSDMEVTYQDITLATIDEALSGPRFVKEVGATGRRMNIVSDISRPSTQQCTIINQTWSEVFVDEEFKPPIGGTYQIQSPGQPTQSIRVFGQDDDLPSSVEP